MIKLPGGADAVLTKLALISKRKDDGTWKHRLIWDLLRSEVNNAVVAPEQLRDAALALLAQAIAGKLDWKARRAEKLAPVKLSQLEQIMAFSSSMAVVGGKAGPNYPAPMLALKSM